MLQFSAPNRVAFVSPYPPETGPIAAFTSNLVEIMKPTSYEAFEPVIIALHSDVSREYPEDVNFVIRREFHSDYMEAADFINAGYGDVVIAQHSFDLYGGQGSDFFTDFLKRVDVPVITTLHEVSPDLPASHRRSLADIHDLSVKVMVRDVHSFELLTKKYNVSQQKINLICSDKSDYLLDQQNKWFYAARQYWRLVEEQLHQYAGNIRSIQAEKEHSLLFDM